MRHMTDTRLASRMGAVLAHNGKYIPGGISSTNRTIEPPLAFDRGRGAYIWDVAGKRYIDYHAAFGPYFLGHNFAPVNQAVVDVLHAEESLFGAGPSVLEGRLAELVCGTIPAVDKVTLLNTGSEATALAIRLARAVTSKRHIIVMQGGYNGNYDELACNVLNTVDDIGPRVSPGEYALRPLGAGTTTDVTRFVHVINFNDLESVRYVCQRYPVAALITEPVLQNIGVVPPGTGYLAGLRELANEFHFILVFDEVKTGFRHAIGGYAALAGVTPDLVVYGKAIANGFPLALVGGKQEFMDYINHPDLRKRPFVAGTYNGHPAAVAAAIKTIEYLAENQATVYPYVEALGQRMEAGLKEILSNHRVHACVARQGSAFTYYFMENPPVDLHDIVERHDFQRDVDLRRALIERGVFFVPIATKQCSISAAHKPEDIEATLEAFDSALCAISRC